MYILGYGSIPPHPNKVRKLITLDTPHQGSLVANWYTGFIENDYWIEPGLPNCPYCNEPCIEPGLPNSSTSEETDEVFIEALKYDETKVTYSELNWFLRTIREKKKLQDGALTFGQAVRQMQVPRDTLGTYMLFSIPESHIAGNRPFDLWGVEYWVLRYLYPFDEDNPGPCRETWRPAVANLTDEFLSQLATDGTDGVVDCQSQLTLEGNERKNLKSTFVVGTNHFEVTKNEDVWDKVLQYLTNNQVSLLPNADSNGVLQNPFSGEPYEHVIHPNTGLPIYE